jgi:hypothetical protein
MRIKAPPAFDISMSGPEGAYTLSYAPTDDWDGEIAVSIGGISMRWAVLNVEEDQKGLRLGGMTSGSEPLWRDAFWFELWPEADQPRIDYYGDRILWRSDAGPRRAGLR